MQPAAIGGSTHLGAPSAAHPMGADGAGAGAGGGAPHMLPPGVGQIPGNGAWGVGVAQGQAAAAIAAAHAAAAAAAVGAASGAGVGVCAGMPVGGRGPNGAAEDEAYRTAQMKRRKQLLDVQVEESRSTWVHPSTGQEETIIFHRIRALISLTGLSQSFICRVTSVTPAALSQYLRCNFRGRQDLLEDKLELFVNDYLDGKYDGAARRGQPGRRSIARRPEQPSAANALQLAGAGAGAGAAAQQALMQRHAQAQAQAQRYAAAQGQAQYGQHGMYARYSQAQTHLTAQQQQALMHQELLRRQQQQQVHMYQQQLLARQQHQQRAAAAAAAAAKAAAPAIKLLEPSVAVERAFHAYHSAVVDITSTESEPLLLPIEIHVSVTEEQVKEAEAEMKAAEEAAKAKAAEKEKASDENKGGASEEKEMDAAPKAAPDAAASNATPEPKAADDANKSPAPMDVVSATQPENADKEVTDVTGAENAKDVEKRDADESATAMDIDNTPTAKEAKEGSGEPHVSAAPLAIDSGPDTSAPMEVVKSSDVVTADGENDSSQKDVAEEGETTVVKSTESVAPENAEGDTEANGSLKQADKDGGGKADDKGVRKEQSDGEKLEITEDGKDEAVKSDDVEQAKKDEAVEQEASESSGAVLDLVHELVDSALTEKRTDGKSDAEMKTVDVGTDKAQKESEKAAVDGAAEAGMDSKVDDAGSNNAKKDAVEAKEDNANDCEGSTDKASKESEEVKTADQGDVAMTDVSAEGQKKTEGSEGETDVGKVVSQSDQEDKTEITKPTVPSSKTKDDGSEPNKKAPKDEETKKTRETMEALARELFYFTQWDVNEKRLSPEEIAKEIVAARKVHPALTTPIALAIRKQLFHAGIACAVPPSHRDRENRRRIAIRVQLVEDEDDYLEDAFDWDISVGEYNSPEVFAQHLCSDHGVSQYHVPQVAAAIRCKVAIAHAASYGDAETRAAALGCLDDGDPLREQLPALTCGVRRLTPADLRAIAERKVKGDVVEPLLRAVEREARRRVGERAEADRRRRKREAEEERRQEEQQAKRRAAEQEGMRVQRALSMRRDAAMQELGVSDIPYFDMKLGRGVHPSVWTGGLLLRKKDGKRVLPLAKEVAGPAGSGPKDEKAEAAPAPTPAKRKGRKEKKGDTPARKRTPGRRKSAAGASAAAAGEEGGGGSGTGNERKRRASARTAGGSAKRSRK